MSLKQRIQQIAYQTTKATVGTISLITQNNTTSTSTNTVLAGQVQAFTNGFYVISFPDGSTQNCLPGGIRQIGPGSCVLVCNGAIIG